MTDQGLTATFVVKAQVPPGVDPMELTVSDLAELICEREIVPLVDLPRGEVES